MLLNRREYFVKEKVAMLKLTDTYDIFDPESGQLIGIARDEPAPWAKWARLVVKNKSMLPTTVNIYEEEESPPVLSMQKGGHFLRAKVTVYRGRGEMIGSLVSKLFSLGGGFFVHDGHGNPIAEVKGDWKGWNFKLLDTSGNELGVVTKKWAGVGKELFTSADNYAIAFSEGVPSNPDLAALLLAAGLAIDILFKERKG